MTARKIFTARFLWASRDELHEEGGLVVSNGHIDRVLTSRGEVKRAAESGDVSIRDLGDTIVTPGLVNAHAHLELGALEGKLPRDGTFADWIRALLIERGKLSREDLRTGLERGARRLLATGCTLVGDIDSTGLVREVLRDVPLRARVYKEVLDVGDTERTRTVASELGELEERDSGSDRVATGISPHAPYTVSCELMSIVGRSAAEHSYPIAVHWAETTEELDWMETGTGPFAGLLPPTPNRPGLDLLEAAQLVGPRTALIHGNHPRRDEVQRVAQSGATVVHCPGTHRFFAREPFPLAIWRAAGVSTALGTDSLASNDDLDLCREMSLYRAAHPELAPHEILRAATETGARALHLEGCTGRLAEGLRADFAAFDVGGAGSRDALEALTCGEARAVGTWIGGTRVAGPSATDERG